MKVLIAGDFCPHDRVFDAFERGQYASVLEEVRVVTSSVDYSIVNFECPIVEQKAKPINKQGPALCCPPSHVQALKYAGFQCVTLANNHFLDYGEVGVRDSIATFDALGIEHVGGGVNLKEAAQILYKKIGDKTLAVINCCEHEFSIASNNSGGSNPLNPIVQYYSVREAREKADRVLVIVHGGYEHFQLPSPRMVEIYRFFIDAGADAVVNHHQHCYSGYELYKGKPIIYGLGNLCFDWLSMPRGTWNEGVMISIDFTRESPFFVFYPYKQCEENATIILLTASAYSNRIKELNSIISNPVTLSKKVDEYFKSCSDQYSRVFEPIQNRYYLGAKKRGWCPSLISKSKLLSLYNYVFCESHRDKLMRWLENAINK